MSRSGGGAFVFGVRGQSVEQQQNHALRRTILPFGRLTQLDLGGTVTNILPPECNMSPVAS